MSEDEVVTKRLNVEGIQEDLFKDFKVCVLLNDTTIKKVIMAHLEDYVEACHRSLEKEKKKKSKG